MYSYIFQACGNVQHAQIIYKHCEHQPLSKKSSQDPVQLTSSTDSLSFTSSSSNSNNFPNKTEYQFPFSLDSPITVHSEGSTTESEEFKIPSEIDVANFIAEIKRTAQLESEFEEKILEGDELKDLDKAIKTEVLEILESSNTQELQIESISSRNIENPDARNPLLILLQNSGLRCQELVNNPNRNDVILEGHDINLIAKVTVKHLISLATPPKRKVSPPILTKWAEYLKHLFPKTPTSSFYAFKYEPSLQKKGTIIQKKRAEGALQVQLFQERRKLIKEDRSVLLRCSNVISSEKPGPSGNTPIRNTWRLVNQQEKENVQPCSKVSIGNFFVITLTQNYHNFKYFYYIVLCFLFAKYVYLNIFFYKKSNLISIRSILK